MYSNMQLKPENMCAWHACNMAVFTMTAPVEALLVNRTTSAAFLYIAHV